MLRDVEYFQSRLSKIDAFDDAAEHLLKIIRSREVKSSAPPVPTPSAAPPAISSPIPTPIPESVPATPREMSGEKQSAELQAQIGVAPSE